MGILAQDTRPVNRDIGKTEGHLNRIDEIVANIQNQQTGLADKIYRIAGYPIEKCAEGRAPAKLEPANVSDRLELIYENLNQISSRNNALYEYLKDSL